MCHKRRGVARFIEGTFSCSPLRRMWLLTCDCVGLPSLHGRHCIETSGIKVQSPTLDDPHMSAIAGFLQSA